LKLSFLQEKRLEHVKEMSYREFLEEAFDHFMGIAEELEDLEYGSNSLINRKTLEVLTLQSLMKIREELEKERSTNSVQRGEAREADQPIRDLGNGKPRLVEVIRQEIWRY